MLKEFFQRFFKREIKPIEECLICGFKNPKDFDRESYADLLDPNEYIDGPIRKTMIKRHCCFNCAHWLTVYKENKKNPRWVRIDGQSWIAKEWRDVPADRFAIIGSGGRIMYAMTDDKVLIRSNNWWHQGDIPKWFKIEYAPDNARWITEKQYEEYKQQGYKAI